MERLGEYRTFLSYEEALQVLPEGDEIHTLYDTPMALIGEDWSREDIEDKLKESDYIEVTGGTARKLSHGIAVYNKGTKHEEIVFIETDEAKLKKQAQNVCNRNCEQCAWGEQSMTIKTEGHADESGLASAT